MHDADHAHETINVMSGIETFQQQHAHTHTHTHAHAHAIDPWKSETQLKTARSGRTVAPRPPFRTKASGIPTEKPGGPESWRGTKINPEKRPANTMCTDPISHTPQVNLNYLN